MNINRDGNLDLTTLKYVEGNVPRELSEGDVLFNNTNSPDLIGKSTSIQTNVRLGYSNHMTRLRLEDGLHPQFFARQLHFLWMCGYFRHRCTNHVNQASISTDPLADTVPIHIPPSAEQTRIIETLDELTTDLDAGVAALQRVQARLKIYRAAVLKAAVDGSLTEDWRQQHPHVEPASELLKRILVERRKRWEEEQLQKFTRTGKNPPKNWQSRYKEPKDPDFSCIWDTPESWTWVGVEALAVGTSNAIKAGPFGSSLKKEHYVADGYKIYGQEQVIRNDPHFGDYYISSEHYQRLASCSVKAGDLLISLVGTTGKVLILPTNLEPGIINPRLIKISVNPEFVYGKYLKLFIESPQARAFIKEKAHGETMDVLNMTILKQFPLPLPPFEEQLAIIETVEDQLSIIDHIAADVNQKLKETFTLRQAILQKAFTGQLVSQDPDDEPASELLKRIATEREACLRAKGNHKTERITKRRTRRKS